jgi:serine/threonine-protein kinase RsbW
MAMLAEMIAFVEGFCAEQGIAREDRLRLTLIVEELFTNSVVHGHGGGADAPIQVSLSCDGNEVALTYEDSAPPFDPLGAAAGERLASAGALEARPVGGLGVLLVGQLARESRYAYEGGRNRLSLRLACRPA